MAAKNIIFNAKAKEKLKKGINELADAVAITLGPKGRNVGISSWAMPKITNEGNAILNEISLKDEFENMGVILAQKAANQTKQICSDGTTTVIVLLRSIVNEAIKYISSNTNLISIIKGLEKGLKLVLEEIDNISKEVAQNDIKNVALASSGDEKIANDIAYAFKKAKNASITIECNKKTETEIQKVEGMEIKRGYLSPYFCNTPNMTIEMTNPKILITDKKISSIHDLLAILQTAAIKSEELLIIADDIDADTLATLVINKIKKIVKVAAIKTPGIGNRKKDYLEDMAILCSGTFISEDKGLILKNTSYEDLATAKKVIITKEKTIIINTNSKNINQRLNQLEKEKEIIKDSFEKKQIEERILKLKGGVIVIKVGAFSEIELKEKKQKYENCLNLLKAAIKQGIVPGGGIALLRASKKLNELKLDNDSQIGIKILKKATLAPIKQIISNAGLNYHLIIEKLLKKDTFYGFNVINEQIEDFFASGIIDPAIVIKTALEQAVSTAKLILLSEVLITSKE